MKLCLSRLCAAICALALLAGCASQPAASSSLPSTPPEVSSAPAEAPSEVPTEPAEPGSAAAPEEPSVASSAPADTPSEASSSTGSLPTEAPSEPLLFRGEQVVSAYAVNYDDYLAAPLTTEEIAQILPALETYHAQEDASIRGSFLLFTETGRHYVDLNDPDPNRDIRVPDPLLDTWMGAWRGVYHAQWFVHMTPAKLEKVTFSGNTGDMQHSIGLTLTDRASLDRVADFLKTDFTVESLLYQGEGINNPNMPSDLMIMTLEFSTGVTYTCIGYTEEFSIHTSDLDYFVGYDTTKAATLALRDLMYALSQE